VIRGENRGQSETVGFVLVFALIVSSTGVVYVTGFESLDSARTAEETNNMERAFDVLDENLRDLSRRGAPSRATEIRLGNGDLSVGDSTTITINATYVANGTRAGNVSVGVRPIVYRLDRTEVVYTSGAIIRREGNAPVVRSRPRWVVTDDVIAIPLVVTVPDQSGRTTAAGDATILVRSERTGRSLPTQVDPAGSAVNVTVIVESTRAAAWGRILDEYGFTPIDGDPSDGTVTYSTETDELQVSQTNVRVGFTR